MRLISNTSLDVAFGSVIAVFRGFGGGVGFASRLAATFPGQA
jgi:hypothetical protein